MALAGWVAMENLGGILTGSASDVGTGPVLILLALAFLAAPGPAASRPGGSLPPRLQRCRHHSLRGSRLPAPTRQADPLGY